ncbi:ABC transporter substrate-binding protein [Komagataeibacter sp. SM21]|uniref:ABC transporter substrate-binding protein n=1 Tax=Komagataeibacter sp. SM21 TaxID=3242899 RepID=UPI0035287403
MPRNRRMIHPTTLWLLLAGSLTALAQPACASTVTIALAGEINTFDPDQTNSIGTDLSVMSNIYPSLLLRAPDGTLVPSLATQWHAGSDTVWHFTLRAGARFTDGEPIDAQTVKWNIQRILNRQKVTPVASWYAQIADVQVISPTQLDIRTSSPYPALPAQLSMMFLLPPKWARTHDPAHEVSSGGPYIVDEIVPGDHVSLHANPDYYGPRPAFDRAIYRIIPETNTALYALQAGEVDYVSKFPTNQIGQINSHGGATAGAVPSSRTVFIKLNTEKPPFDNAQFRQALNYAIDKQTIADTIFDGHATPSGCEVLTPDYFGYNRDLPGYGYDPQRARRLIAESGVDLSRPFEFDIPRGSYLQGEEVALAIQAMFNAVGIRTRIRMIDFATYLARYRKAHDLSPVSLLGQAWPTLDAAGFLKLFQTGNAYSYWSDPTFDAALKAGESTLDQTMREQAYAAATRTMCTQAPVVFLYIEPATYAYSKRISLVPRGDGWVRAFDMKPAR